MTNDQDAGPAGTSNPDTAYFLQRAAWHAHRAAVATESSTRSLHRKFAGLYEARSRS